MNYRDQFAYWAERSGLLRLTSSLNRRRSARHLGAFGYHRIAERLPDEPWSEALIDATPAELRRQLNLNQRYGHCVGMQAVRALSRGDRLVGTPTMLTFDDGYRSCVDVVLPLLMEFGITATFFIPTAFIEERRMHWWDQVAYLLKQTQVARVCLGAPWNLHLDVLDRGRAAAQLAELVEHEPGLDRSALLTALAEALEVHWDLELEQRFADELLMSWDDIERLQHAGMDIQSHTVSHRILQTIPAEELEQELTQSRQTLERRLGAEVDALAYPSGYPILDQPKIVAAVKDAGYRFGFTYGGGASSTRDFNPWNIKRMAVDQGAGASMPALQAAWPSWSYEGPRAKRYARAASARPAHQ